ncbi:Glyceraldehyde-3-phosphate dehydrogenase-like family protein [Striga hermonthica]|uniref:Homoserine dehydrogenase n=1 Tax=Striga hermonthica TaxID=68872 RepID=A0A9N7MRG5_STRHE|nr:Glyceraldehyde-3-phosphate dehydrogenase-like family protein [Striga hermonthica]
MEDAAAPPSSSSGSAVKGVRLRVVGVCDSKSMVVKTDFLISELDDEFLLRLCEVKSSGSSLGELADFGECEVVLGHQIERKIVDVAATLSKSSGLVVVDCSASSETISLLNQVVSLYCCVVLANKKPLTSPLEHYDKLVSRHRRIRYESTVGAGLPVISTINRILSSGDPISRILGSLSGTLGYVMSEVESGRPFSQVVNAAKHLGYTEPDPRDDLSGMDVARKALILARLLGHRINLDSIKVESLFPVDMGPDVMPLEEFLVNGLPLIDKDIQKRIDNAGSKGNVLRYVCLIEESRCEVGIQEVAKDSALGRLKGSDNVLEIYSRCYREQPLVIQGAGAGNDTTAAAHPNPNVTLHPHPENHPHPTPAEAIDLGPEQQSPDRSLATPTIPPE